MRQQLPPNHALQPMVFATHSGRLNAGVGFMKEVAAKG